MELPADRYIEVRQQSERACETLVTDDFCLQADVFVSPPKWHLAHTSWFFETFLLKPFQAGYRDFDPAYAVLFNSYYNGIGEQFPRPQRGLLSRPTVTEIIAYRRHVDEAMTSLLEQTADQHRDEIALRLELGLHHEQQHQELFYTDLKYSLSINPLYPAYTSMPAVADSQPATAGWQTIAAGLYQVGNDAAMGFCFDNEGPLHRVHLEACEISERLVSNADYQAFVDDGAYQRPELWLADAWTVLQQRGWQQPLYWRQLEGQAMEYSLFGLIPRSADAPVSHLSAYEADAFARWTGARLPTEFEWEIAAAGKHLPGADAASQLHPLPSESDRDSQYFGQLWQWTSSAYGPYPGYKPSPGAIGEYNGKFMCNQLVLRGSSCVTAAGHARCSYRNFFYPADRWQFSGLRLARST